MPVFVGVFGLMASILPFIQKETIDLLLFTHRVNNEDSLAVKPVKDPAR